MKDINLIKSKETFKTNLNKTIIETIFKLSKKTYKKSGVKFRKFFNPYLTKEFSKTIPHKIKLYRNDYIKGDKPTIYVATHVFYDDVASIICAIKENMYLVGDTGIKTDISLTEAFGLYLNGVKLFEKDREIAPENEHDDLINNIQSVLLNNGNILIFPESTWNFSPNRLIREELPYGVLKIAKATGAEIAPVAFDEVNNEYLVSVGEKIELIGDNSYDITTVRDSLATLVYELIELKTSLSRAEIGEDEIYWNNYIKSKMQGDNYDLSNEERLAFRPKNSLTQDELVSDLYGIKYHSIATNYDEYLKVKKLSMNYSEMNSYKNFKK